jgi:hypothetical protein
MLRHDVPFKGGTCRIGGWFQLGRTNDIDSAAKRRHRMIGWRKRSREWAGLAAVLALLLHTIVAGLVDGALAAPELLDNFGNVVCTAHGAEKAPSVPGQPGNHSHLPDCCLVGCSVAGGHAASASPILVTPLLATIRLNFGPLRPDRAIANSERSPQNPRAPPTFV